MNRFFHLLIPDNAGLGYKKEMLSRFNILAVALVFGVIHLMFLAYYSAAGIPVLAAANVASVLIYILVGYLALQKGRKLPGFLIVLEVSLYSALTTWLLGWDCGSPGYLPLMVFPCYQLFYTSRRNIRIQVFILSFSLAASYVVNHWYGPVYPGFDTTVIQGANLLICMTCALLVVNLIFFTSSYSEQSYQSRIELLKGEAHRDSLTGLWNRRYASMYLDDVLDHGQRRESSFLAVIDIDQFKSVNDNHGHVVGDELLRIFAHLIQKSFRQTDMVARWGGDEFLLVLTDTNRAGARSALESFRRKVEAMALNAEGVELRITISIGYSSCAHVIDSAKCFANSDTALYFGKNNGRNQVIDYGSLARGR